MPGIHLHFARDIETLAAELARVVATPLSSPLARDALVVGCAGMDRWIGQELAKARGVWVPAWTATPRAFVTKLIALTEDGDAAAASSFETTAWTVARAIDERLALPDFLPVRRYLEHDDDQSKRIALARRVAELYEKYALHRPDLLREPATGELAWQSMVMADVGERLGDGALDRRLRALSARLVEAPAGRIPERISVFGAASLPARVLDLLEVVAARAEVHLFVPRVSDALSRETQPQHALLAALSKQTRAGVAQATERAQTIVESAAGRALGTTALEHLQRELAADVPRGPTAESRERVRRAAEDRSIEIFSCHGPMREAETVRDRLLAMFAADPTLRPRDVAILTPDLDAYAPYLEAAFATGDGEKLPIRIADGGGRRKTTAGRALLDALDVLRGRFAASSVLELCAHPTVRARYEFEETDLETLACWIDELAVHWGADAEHRRALGHVDDLEGRTLGIENTWRVGLDRLLVGVAVPGHDERMVHDLLPYDDVEGDRAELAGRAATLIEGLLALRHEITGARTPAAWRAVIDRVVDHLLPTRGPLAFERASLLRRLGALWDGAATAGYETPLTLAALLPWLEAVADDEAVGVGFASGPITAGALLPMRQVPFRVIAIVGLADGGFPRRTHVDPLDRTLVEPRPLDPSARDEDRGAFLDAILAARERLIVTYPGRDAQENTKRPPCVVVSELVDTIEATFESEASIVTEVPLAPWDPRLFERGPVQTTSTIFAEGARATLRPAEPEPPFVQALLAEVQADVIDLGAMARRLGAPIKNFLKDRLQLDLSRRASVVQDLDPHDVDPLEQWWLRDRIFHGHEKGGAASQSGVQQALRASGRLPPGAAGDAAIDDAAREAQSLLDTVASARGGARLPPRSIDVRVAGVRIVGSVDCLYPNGRVIIRTGSMRLEHQVELWLHHLAMIVDGNDETFRSSIVYCGKGKARVACHWSLAAPKTASSTTPAPTVIALAGRLLADLVDLYRTAGVAPLLAFDGGTQAAAKALIAGTTAGLSDEDRADRARNVLRANIEDGWQMEDADTTRALRGGLPWELGFTLPAGEARVPDAVAVAERLVVPMLLAEVP